MTRVTRVAAEFLQTHGASLAIHAAVLGALTLFVPAARRVLSPTPTIEFQLHEVPAAAPRPAAPASSSPSPPAPAPAELPPVPRPARVPERAQVARVDRPRPFRENADPEAGTREAPPDVPAAPPATTPLLAMETTIAGGTATEYVTTAEPRGTMGVRAGRGSGGRGGVGGNGTPGPEANQAAADVRATPDWQVTSLPEPLNADDFEPRYPPLALRERREAVVVVRLHIDDKGRVAEARVVDGAGHGFDEAALEYTRRLRFRPAMVGRRAVPSRIDWSVHFYARN